MTMYEIELMVISLKNEFKNFAKDIKDKVDNLLSGPINSEPEDVKNIDVSYKGCGPGHYKETAKGTFEWALSIMKNGGKVRLPEWLGYWYKHEDGYTAAFTRTGDIKQAWLDRGYQNRHDWEEAHGLSFEWALTAMKAGKKVRRSGWNGKGMYIWYVPEMMVPKEWLKEDGLIEVCEKFNREYVHCEPTIRIFTAQKTVSTGWKPSNLDMFSNDWELAE